MNDELFAPAEINSESPRLKWCKEFGVLFHYAKDCNPPWSCWLPKDNADFWFTPIPRDPSRAGYGRSEEEACLDLAEKNHLPVWTM